jgi:hypothetical protein
MNDYLNPPDELVMLSKKVDANVFTSAKMYGCDQIIMTELNLNNSLVLPITIPHGIDFYHLAVDLDLHLYEPVYMAFRDDIAERVAEFKAVLRFPHPWLLITSQHKDIKGQGTLFIAPPPSQKGFEAMLTALTDTDYPKPWGVLIKDRGAQQEDFEWWEAKGFIVHCAGSVDDGRFFYNLRDIFVTYASVVSPIMSSAVIFAVAMKRMAFALPNVQIECVDVANWDELCELADIEGKVARVWRCLLSNDPNVALTQAEDLLGMKFMDTSEELKKRLFKAIASSSDNPVHLYPINNWLLYRVCVWLIVKGVPVHKFFPNPLPKVLNRLLSHLRLNRLMVITGSDFSHAGVAGHQRRLRTSKVFAFRLGKSAKVGNAVRD